MVYSFTGNGGKTCIISCVCHNLLVLCRAVSNCSQKPKHGNQRRLCNNRRYDCPIYYWTGKKYTLLSGAHLSDAPPPEDGYLLRGIVQGSRMKLPRALPSSLTWSVYNAVTRDLGLKSHPKDNFELLPWPAWESNPQSPVFKSSGLPTKQCGLVTIVDLAWRMCMTTH